LTQEDKEVFNSLMKSIGLDFLTCQMSEQEFAKICKEQIEEK
jgi:hypothetical protein